MRADYRLENIAPHKLSEGFTLGREVFFGQIPVGSFEIKMGEGISIGTCIVTAGTSSNISTNLISFPDEVELVEDMITIIRSQTKEGEITQKQALLCAHAIFDLATSQYNANLITEEDYNSTSHAMRNYITALTRDIFPGTYYKALQSRYHER